MMESMVIYLVTGCIAGLLAGLLGIGGGLVIVPILVFYLPLAGILENDIMHLALGTSMASIVFTSISSFWTHHKNGAVHWKAVRHLTIGILPGAFIGTCIASYLSTGLLKISFSIFLFYASIQMLGNRKPKPARSLPGKLGMFGTGNFIGSISSLTGIGGGTLSVPFMVWCNLSIHHAIGTAAAIGFPIAVSGSLGYIFNGLDVPGLPDYAIGYIYLPALAGIVCASVVSAPFGAKISHCLPVLVLKRIFAVLLVFVGLKMITTSGA